MGITVRGEEGGGGFEKRGQRSDISVGEITARGHHKTLVSPAHPVEFFFSYWKF